MDLQYRQHVSLDHAGSSYTRWRDILKTDFALFLERMTGIQRPVVPDFGVLQKRETIPADIDVRSDPIGPEGTRCT